ncbi:MAG: peptidoglycan-binding protein [Lachnospiraceae bacterium]|nr:peptidoglycan-binding protein [Robinsoniella sp.]MDY3765742.1 peptidoglycan-binding protein [Lachnospiraceae bacterium]
MERKSLRAMQQEAIDTGNLRVRVRVEGREIPVPDADVKISYSGEPDSTVEEVVTDSTGQTESVVLKTPPLEYSMEPSEVQPYSEYTLQISAPGYESVTITGAELLSAQTALQEVWLRPVEVGEVPDVITIPDHTLYGVYPPKIAESEIKPMETSGEIVLSRVVIPEYVVVHDGSPRDTTAGDYYVRYRDYIKNVASSEIYATWPRETIMANVLAIMSFTLNRVYTEWYRNKGFDFTITSSTAFDQKWIYGRNTFESIAEVVDELFDSYLSRPNVKQPILTQYCDGNRVTCPNWMSQWGSKNLGDQGYQAMDIIRYYYGDSMYRNTAEEISGIPASWPGYSLDIGSSGPKVRQIQEQLNTISEHYPRIPKIAADGIYGEKTQDAVRVFQSVFGLPQTGVVDYRTWYKIQEIYVGVTRIAELV